MAKKKKAFVLMPFDQEFTSIYEKLIKPALEEAGYEVARADSFIDQQNILRDVVRGIAEADLIVADLTALNPNVFYELGLAHGLAIPTILLSQSMDEVPFDLRGYKIQPYSTHFDEAFKLGQTLKEIGERHAKGEVTFGSPITDFLPRASIASAKTAIGVRGSETEGKFHEEEKGFLDFVVEGNEAGAKIAHTISALTQETAVLTNNMTGHTMNIQAISQNPGLSTASEIHRIASMVASDMNSLSESTERKLPDFERNIETFIEGYSRFIALLEINSDDDKAQAMQFRLATASMLDSTEGALRGARSFREAVRGLKEKGISQKVNRASRQLDNALFGFISSVEKMEAFCLRTLHLIDERLDRWNHR